MVLHHRPELENMRSAYSYSTRSRESDSSESSRSDRTGSERSYATAPTEYSASPGKRPPYVHQHQDYEEPRPIENGFFTEGPLHDSPRGSVSTVQSEEEMQEEEDEVPDYDVPEYTAQPYQSRVIPATPSDFSELFPSHRRMTVRHDDSTLDGNMNLRLDTEVSIHGRKCDMTLFHLRMHDLKNREFSLRRYCRDSGREVCHSERKQAKSKTEKRPGFQRSLSNAINSMRTKSETRTPTLSNLKRADSGYGSLNSVDLNELDRPRSAGQGALAQPPLEDTMRLEFSNYAHVDVKRTGVKPNKRYDFEYWGVHYSWRRMVRKDSTYKEISYQLTKVGSDKVLAYIMPLSLSPAQHWEEQGKGGWIPPCSMWLADDKLIRGQKDAVDVVIASGLIALVDDAVRARFHSSTSTQLLIPIHKKQWSVDYIGPKRLINEAFRRDTGSGQLSRPSTSSGRPRS